MLTTIIDDPDDSFAAMIDIDLGLEGRVTLHMDLSDERTLMHQLIERAKARGEHLTL